MLRKRQFNIIKSDTTIQIPKTQKNEKKDNAFFSDIFK